MGGKDETICRCQFAETVGAFLSAWSILLLTFQWFQQKTGARISME